MLRRKKRLPEAGISTSKFWEWFSKNEKRFRPPAKHTLDEKRLDELFQRLRSVNQGFSVEIGRPDEDSYELIVSADSNPNVFDAVFSLIKEAPKVKGWRFTALKPPFGVGFTYDDGLIALETERLMLIPMTAEHTHRVGVSFIISDAKAASEEHYITALWRVLETVIGEWLISEAVAFVEIRQSIPQGAHVLKLAELEPYVRARMTQFGLRDPFDSLN